MVDSAHSAELPKGAARNIVLVHGAFVDQTSWQPVADILTKKGYNVTLVENPLTSLAADVDATKQALAKQDGKTVLVGHSWGGVVITEAGNDPKVSALVYVSAFAPDVGQSLATLAKSGPATEGAAAIHPDDKGNLYIDPKVFPSAVAADLPPEDRRAPGQLAASIEPRCVRSPRRHGRLARQANVLRDQHQGQGNRTRCPEVFRSQDEGPDDGSRRQSCFARRSCRCSRGGDRKGHTREVTVSLPAVRAGSAHAENADTSDGGRSRSLCRTGPPTRLFHAKHPEDEMTQLDIARKEIATLETAPTRYVEGYGIRFAYRRLGPATGTPLVLLQHFSGNIDAWDPAVVNALATDRPVIAFDNAGVGRSTGQTPDNIAAMARDAVAFINLLGLSEVDLLGFSLGGCVAQQIAAEHERLVRKLILVGTAPKGGEEHLLAVLHQAFSQTDAPDPRLPLFFTNSSASRSSGLAFLKRTKVRKYDRDADNGTAVTDPQAKALITWCSTPDPEHAILRAIRQPLLWSGAAMTPCCPPTTPTLCSRN